MASRESRRAPSRVNHHYITIVPNGWEHVVRKRILLEDGDNKDESECETMVEVQEKPFCQDGALECVARVEKAIVRQEAKQRQKKQRRHQQQRQTNCGNERKRARQQTDGNTSFASLENDKSMSDKTEEEEEEEGEQRESSNLPTICNDRSAVSVEAVPNNAEDCDDAQQEQQGFIVGSTCICLTNNENKGKHHKAENVMVSLGYHRLDSSVSEPRRILCRPGQLEGTSFLHWESQETPSQVASLQGIGPLLAQIGTWSLASHGEQSSSPSRFYTLQQIVSTLEQRLKETFDDNSSSSSYRCCFHRALELWHAHVKTVSPTRETSVSSTTSNQSLGYRISCVRSHGEKYSFTREEFIRQVEPLLLGLALDERDNIDAKCEKMLLETTTNRTGACLNGDSKDENNPCNIPSGWYQRENWRVDLTNYDLELVAFIHNSMELTLAISLRPPGASSWQAGNRLPPEGTTLPVPHVNAVRLRPSTATLLLEVANLQTGEVVMDPCCGVGTIPMQAASWQASLAHSKARVFAWGGDVALGQPQEPSSCNAISTSTSHLQASPQSLLPPQHGGGSTDLLAWDATLLAVRDSVVDCIVSDLPFGQKCLSSNALSALLPPLLWEFARVLQNSSVSCRGGGGGPRMVLLCGNYQPIVTAMEYLNQLEGSSTRGSTSETGLFVLPCQSIFPVNVGGFVAWVVIVQRGPCPISALPNHRDRVRRMVQRRKLQRMDSCQK